MRVHYSTYSQCRLHYCYTYGKINAGAAQGELPVCVAVRYLTLRIGCERYGRKNPLPYSFSKRSHIGNLRRIRKQGKGRSSKRKGNRRCPFLFAHRRGYGAVPAAGAAISRAPQSATPRRISAKNSPPVRDEHAYAVRVPRSAGAEKNCRPDRVNRLRGSGAPIARCSEKECRTWTPVHP